MEINFARLFYAITLLLLLMLDVCLGASVAAAAAWHRVHIEHIDHHHHHLIIIICMQITN